MSILVVFLLVGGSFGKYLGNQDNNDVLQPIVSPSQSRRICASLCMSGLGGEKCGDFCLDIAPQQLPLRSLQNVSVNTLELNTRKEACPVLCDNHLGYPLCKCSSPPTKREIDFVEVCGFFCIHYNYKIDGCQPCKVYKDEEDKSALFRSIRPKIKSVRDNIDWQEWCRDRCSVGDGGVACNCDILPLMAPITVA